MTSVRSRPLEVPGVSVRQTGAVESFVANVTGGRDAAAVPGAAIGVIHEGRSDLAVDGVISIESGSPVTVSTLFLLGSVSKLYTATAVMALVDQGRIGLEGRGARYRSEVNLGPAAETLTVEHLLSHRGGWQGDWSLFNAPTSSGAEALRNMVAYAADVPRYALPGAPYSYDNFGFCVAGALIE